ncbi:MAG: recombinase family protein [Bryobacteraceae bacterium]
MAVAVYCRVSTEEQREKQSIATQRDFARRYCELHSLAVHEVYADDGVSGTVPLEKRPAGISLLQAASAKRFDQILVYRLDRFGRDARLILNAVDELEKCGVRIKSMSEEFDTGSASGRLMLTLLSGFAAHERDSIRERSMLGTDRLAETGAWLGGIVPFGYRKAGEKRDAHLVISEEPIPGLDLSEAEVIRRIFKMAAIGKKSCIHIAEELNRLGVPCAYVRDDRLVVRGKRKTQTAGVWSPGRIRNLIISATYKGEHAYGKRSKNAQREPITRAVPAIVSDKVWEKAQRTLRDNFLFAKRSARNQYLLRGLIKCGVCGLTYIGLAANRPNGKREFYYKCNGAHSPSIYAGRGRCESKAVRGDHLEAQVWSDVESFLRNPEPVLQQLQERLQSDAKGSEQIRAQVARLEGLLAQKATERSRVVGLYRRGRLTDADLDAQMDEIGKEEATLEARVAELRGKIAGADSIGATLSSAETLLAKLRKRLDQPVSWEQKRQLIEVLVAGIQVDTVEECGVKQAKTTVSYRFAEPDQPMPLVLPQSYSPVRVVHIPTQPRTVGDHIRRRRLALKLMQKDVAEQIGVCETSVFNWEANTSQPDIRFMPAVIGFLGYNPLPEATTLAEQLVRHRTTRGLSQKEAARDIGVDQGTLARWERGEREPAGRLLDSVTHFLTGDRGQRTGVRRAG